MTPKGVHTENSIYTNPNLVYLCGNNVVSSQLYYDDTQTLCLDAALMGKRFTFANDDGKGWHMYVSGDRTTPLVSFSEHPLEKAIADTVKHFANAPESSKNLSLILPAKLGPDGIDGFIFVPVDQNILAQLQTLQEASIMIGNSGGTLRRDIHGTREISAYAVPREVAEKIYGSVTKNSVAITPTEKISQLGEVSYLSLHAEYDNGHGYFVDSNSGVSCSNIPDIPQMQAATWKYIEKHQEKPQAKEEEQQKTVLHEDAEQKQENNNAPRL